MIYLDNAATTRTSKAVVDAISDVMLNKYGNPASKHGFGRISKELIDSSKKTIAKCLDCNIDNIYFTSGSTEANNWFFEGFRNIDKSTVISTAYEHPSIENELQRLEAKGTKVIRLKPCSEGIITPEQLAENIDDDVKIISIMAVNNVVGAIQPLQKIGNLIEKINLDREERGIERIIFHSDATQLIGKQHFSFKNSMLHAISFSAHKFHGPKGIGGLIIDNAIKLDALIVGGGQQNNMRSGTENVPSVVGMAKAIEEIYKDFNKKYEHISALKAYLVEYSKNNPLGGVTINSPEQSIPHIVNLSIEGIFNEVLLRQLSDMEIYISSGSACSSKSPNAMSSTMEAMDIPLEQAKTALRISFSAENTIEELEKLVNTLNKEVPILRQFSKK